MPRFVALLRSVNVGKTGKVGMAELRGLFGELGFSRVQTLLQSGNVVFESDQRKAEDLEQALPAALFERLGVQTDFFVRDAHQMASVVSANPYPDEAKRDPSHLIVVFTKQAPTSNQVEALQAEIKGRETVCGAAGHLYAVYPDGIGNSKLTLPLIEAKLETRGTGRNWNTVQKLLAMAKVD